MSSRVVSFVRRWRGELRDSFRSFLTAYEPVRALRAKIEPPLSQFGVKYVGHAGTFTAPKARMNFVFNTVVYITGSRFMRGGFGKQGRFCLEQVKETRGISWDTHRRFAAFPSDFLMISRRSVSSESASSITAPSNPSRCNALTTPQSVCVLA